MQSSQPLDLVVPFALGRSVHADFKPLKSPFRKSIWEITGDYRFDKCTEQELDDVALVYDIMAAKLRIAFPTPAVCRGLIVAITTLPDDPAAVPTAELIPMIDQYLHTTKSMRGVGITAAICSLAVLTQGRYAPMDQKVAKGLQNLGVVTAEEVRQLTGSAIRIGSFVQIYATKVLPAWYAETQKRVPEQADAYWGSHAKRTSFIKQE